MQFQATFNHDVLFRQRVDAMRNLFMTKTTWQCTETDLHLFASNRLQTFIGTYISNCKCHIVIPRHVCRRYTVPTLENGAPWLFQMDIANMIAALRQCKKKDKNMITLTLVHKAPKMRVEMASTEAGRTGKIEVKYVDVTWPAAESVENIDQQLAALPRIEQVSTCSLSSHELKRQCIESSVYDKNIQFRLHPQLMESSLCLRGEGYRQCWDDAAVHNPKKKAQSRPDPSSHVHIAYRSTRSAYLQQTFSLRFMNSICKASSLAPVVTLGFADLHAQPKSPLVLHYSIPLDDETGSDESMTKLSSAGTITYYLKEAMTQEDLLSREALRDS